MKKPLGSYRVMSNASEASANTTSGTAYSDTALITLDVDWAPDCAIDDTAAILISEGVKSTWFVTHMSPAIERLRSRPDLFELGIHPCFFSDSTHGATPEAVLRHCMELVPESISMRSHGLAWSSGILTAVLSQTPILIDISILLPRSSAAAPAYMQWLCRNLIRAPYTWEDGYEIEQPDTDWHPGLHTLYAPTIFNFHPIHIFLNSPTLSHYESAKRALTRFQSGTREELAPYVASGRGIQSTFKELVRRTRNRTRHCFARDLLDSVAPSPVGPGSPS